MDIHVLLAGLRYPGNIGLIARTMKNLGYRKLLLYRCNVSKEAYIWASHAKDILENARDVSNFTSILREFNLVVGTTGIVGKTVDRHMRMPVRTPEELRDMIEGMDGRLLLIFGREDYGLTNEELERCDVILSIPTSSEYPVMNVSQSAGIILYILRKRVEGDIPVATHEEIDLLINFFEDLLRRVDYPPHKLPKTILMLRRIFGRAILTKREIQTLYGVTRRIGRKLGDMDG